jgi:ribosomal protein S18 acetylase RimI-like enzyme
VTSEVPSDGGPLPPPRVLVTRAGPADAVRLAGFGRRVFHAAFAAGNDPADLEAYVASAYTPDAQARELADASVTTLLAQDPEGVLLAFAQVRAADVPECVADETAVELWRFYVDQAWHGRGVARTLMDAACDEARARGARTVWLGVWEHNPRAKAFYAKCGFVPVGTHVFVFGREDQTDEIWQKALT